MQICLVFIAFSPVSVFDEQTEFIQQLLSDHYDDSARTLSVKRYELNVTNSGFCRYKRYFSNGKEEYFSFNLTKFRDLDYYGTVEKGELYLRTKGEDVIVQTYNDRKEGDVDSMATYMVIPLRNIEPEYLSDLSERLFRLNARQLAQK